MTDAPLVAKKLTRIETCLAELRRLGDLTRLESDPIQRRFVERTLQIAIQAALDVASHIVSAERFDEPETHRDLFTNLSRGGYAPKESLPALHRLADLRDTLVRNYDDVDLTAVRDVVEQHLADLEHFVAGIRAKL